jgi:hypothetical protein
MSVLVRASSVCIIAITLLLIAGPVPSSAGIDTALCSSSTDRPIRVVTTTGSPNSLATREELVDPKDFFLKACFDGHTLYLKNDSTVTVDVTATGDVSPMDRNWPLQCEAAISDLFAGAPTTLVPQQTARMPVGPGQADVQLKLSSAGLGWGIASAALPILDTVGSIPGGASDTCVIVHDLMAAFNDANESYATCPKDNALSQASCVIGAALTTRRAFDAAGLLQHFPKQSVQAIGELVGLLNPIGWFTDYNKDEARYRDSEKRVRIPARPIDWRNTHYTGDCGGVAPHPFTVTVNNGQGEYGPDPATNQTYDIQVLDVAHGDLLADGSIQTAVLLYCTPQPSNYFKTEIQVFTTGQERLGAALDPPDLVPNGLYFPWFDDKPFNIGSGALVTGAAYYGPQDCHGCGPSIQYLLNWTWDGSRFVPSATRISGRPPALDFQPITPSPTTTSTSTSVSPASCSDIRATDSVTGDVWISDHSTADNVSCSSADAVMIAMIRANDIVGGGYGDYQIVGYTNGFTCRSRKVVVHSYEFSCQNGSSILHTIISELTR